MGVVSRGYALSVLEKPVPTIKRVLIASLFAALGLALIWRFLGEHSWGSAATFGVVMGATFALLLLAIREQRQRGRLTM